VKRHEAFATGDRYTFVALAATSRAIVSHRTGKRDGTTTDEFIQDLRGRVLGARRKSQQTAGARTSFRSAMPSATVRMASSSRRSP